MNHSTIRDGQRWDASVGRWVPMPEAVKAAGPLLTRREPTPVAKAARVLSGVDDRGWHRVFESFTGAWQSNVVVDRDTALSDPTVYACVTLIASDIGKLSLDLREEDADGIWVRAQSPAFSPVLRKPNHFQTRQKFIESWLISKLIYGNAYILKQRDARGVVIALYVLDPDRIRPLVAPDGSVFYEVNSDDLSRLPYDIPAIPAEEIIHDRMECLFHPLVGISPLYACGLAASQALKITNNSAQFFENMARPSGILSAPGQISDETALRLKEHWEKNYRAGNIGKVAVLGDDLKYIPMGQTAVDSQQVEQSEQAAKQICTAFHVPAYMVGVGTPPPYNNTETLNQHYYDKCLHKLIDAIENGLDEGLGLWNTGRNLRTEFDLDDLLRMDKTAMGKSLGELVKNYIMAPNEARKRVNLGPAKGGNSPMAQQQNYSLEALAKRDAQPDPFASNTPEPPAPPPPMEPEERALVVSQAAELAQATKALETMMARMEKEADMAASIRAARAKFDDAEVE
jgi:HK97 family phage portal protein